MKAKTAGKVKEVVLKRSVLKELSPVLSKEIEKPKVGVDATGIKFEQGSYLLTSVATMEGRTDSFVISTFHRALNNLYIQKAKPLGITISLTLRYGGSEKELKQIMRLITAACQEHNVVVLGGETFRSGNAQDNILTIQAIGTKEQCNHQKEWEAGDQIVMAGTAGLAGTVRIYEMERETFQKRFSKAFLQQIQPMMKQLSVREQCNLANDWLYAHDVSEGGIFAALWELGDYLNCGLRISLQNILLAQETIELCEILDLNPYALFSLGCSLFVVKDGAKLVETLEEMNIRASVVGYLTQDSDRILDNGEEIRYLEPYKGDDMYRC